MAPSTDTPYALTNQHHASLLLLDGCLQGCSLLELDCSISRSLLHAELRTMDPDLTAKTWTSIASERRRAK